MKHILIIMALVVSGIAQASDGETRLLRYSGSPIEEPYWFKDSFLELADDISEAKEEDKRLLIYYHQAGCPYCFNLVQQTLLDPQLSQFIQDNFDVIALNLWGDREVTLPSGDVFSEKALAAKWKIQYTPTLLFFDDGAEPVLRIDGYRDKATMAKIFDYVASGGNQEASLAQSLIQIDSSETLYPNEQLQAWSTFDAAADKPTLVLFEYPGCENCGQMHRYILSQKGTHKQLSRYQSMRVDLSSDAVLTLPDGSQKTAKDWAESLGLTYFPSVILLDKNETEQFRIDGYVQSFHFNTALEYVSDGVYQRLPEFQRYINERADRLRDEGENVTITQ